MAPPVGRRSRCPVFSRRVASLVVIALQLLVQLLVLHAVDLATAAPVDPSLARLRNVAVAPGERASVVDIEVVGGPTSARTSVLEAPFRIVLDLEGAVFAWSGPRVTDASWPIREVRGSQWRRDIARVVIELTERVDHRIERTDRGLRIVLDPPAACSGPTVEDRMCPDPAPFIEAKDETGPSSGGVSRSAPEPQGARWDIRGRLQGGGRFWLNGRDEGLEDDGIPLEAEADFRFRDGTDLLLRLHPRLAIDPLLSSRNRYEPLDAYVEYSSGRWTFLAGQAVENWAVVETYNPVDVLNRRDLERDLYDAERLGEVMLRLRYFVPDAGPVEQPSISLYFLPLHRETPLPSNRDRFRFDATGDNRGDLLEDRTVVPSPDVAYAARLSATVGGADLFLVYFGGPTRIPSFAITPFGEVIPTYYLVDMVGGGLQWAIGRWVLKLEAAQTFTTSRGLPRRMRAVVPPDFFQYVVGIERTITEVFGRAELTLALEYAGEDDPDETSLGGLRPYKSDVFLGARLNLNDARRTEIRASVAADVLVDEQLWLFEMVTAIYRDLKLVIGGQVVNRAPQSPAERPTVFNIFPNNSNLWLKLRYDF